MRISRPLLALGVSVLAGCAIHPLPENVTGVPTILIVSRIRCEARDAIKDALIAQLLQSSSQETRNLGKGLDDGDITIAEFRDEHLVPAGHPGIDEISYQRIKHFGGTVIAYHFTLLMTENNNGVVDLEFRDPLTKGLLALNLTGGNDRERKTLRVFGTADTFGELLLDESLCGDDGRQANWIYPVVGNVGVAKAITAFLQLEDQVGLGGKNDAFKNSDFFETLTFDTVFSASATPVVTLMPTTTDFYLRSSSLAPSITRNDQHIVKIGLRAQSFEIDNEANKRAALESLQIDRRQQTQQEILELLQER